MNFLEILKNLNQDIEKRDLIKKLKIKYYEDFFKSIYENNENIKKIFEKIIKYSYDENKSILTISIINEPIVEVLILFDNKYKDLTLDEISCKSECIYFSHQLSTVNYEKLKNILFKEIEKYTKNKRKEGF